MRQLKIQKKNQKTIIKNTLYQNYLIYFHLFIHLLLKLEVKSKKPIKP
jgi:hypothetical protein